MSRFVFVNVEGRDEDGKLVGKMKLRVEKEKIGRALKSFKQAMKDTKEGTKVEEMEWEGKKYTEGEKTNSLKESLKEAKEEKTTKNEKKNNPILNLLGE